MWWSESPMCPKSASGRGSSGAARRPANGLRQKRDLGVRQLRRRARTLLLRTTSAHSCPCGTVRVRRASTRLHTAEVTHEFRPGESTGPSAAVALPSPETVVDILADELVRGDRSTPWRCVSNVNLVADNRPGPLNRRVFLTF